MFETRHRPATSVTVERRALVSTFRTVTFAPGTRASCSSVTVAWNDPVVDWAPRGAAKIATASRASSHRDLAIFTFIANSFKGSTGADEDARCGCGRSGGQRFKGTGAGGPSYPTPCADS